MFNSKEIKPPHVRLKPATPGPLIERIILSSSNCLRHHIGLLAEDTLPGPPPKVVTRKHPSLDNYFADLMLRSCYETVDYLPSYEEHVIYGSQDELPSELNARLVGSLLIGIGGRSSNPDFFRVYDEHSAHGTRTAPSASQIVYQEHLERFKSRPGINSVTLLLEEINSIDSGGGASYDHLYNILKSLNVAEYIHPGFVFEPLQPQWKRAIVQACLMAVCVGRNEFQNYDADQATSDLEKEWDTYIAKIEKRIKYGFPDKIIPEAIRVIRQGILQPKERIVAGMPSHLTLKRILFALRHFWHPSVTAYLLEFLFEAMRQAQQSFEEIRHADVPVRDLPGNYVFVYYCMDPKDRLPHRGLMARMNSHALKGLVVIYNPAHETVAVFGSSHLPKKVWRCFVESLLKKEGESVWYVPTAADGSYAYFILNGTEYYRGIPKTSLDEEGFFRLFAETVGACAAGKAAPGA